MASHKRYAANAPATLILGKELLFKIAKDGFGSTLQLFRRNFDSLACDHKEASIVEAQ